MIDSRHILIVIGLAFTAVPAMAGDNKHEGHIEVTSVGGGAANASGGSLVDGRYVLTSLRHDAQAPSSLGSLRSLGSANDLFANSRGGDQGAPTPRGPTGTGKTLNADLLGKRNDGPATDSAALTEGGGKPQAQMGDGSVRFLRDSISPAPSAKPGGGVPTGTVTFKVDGVAPAGGAAKGAAVARK